MPHTAVRAARRAWQLRPPSSVPRPSASLTQLIPHTMVGATVLAEVKTEPSKAQGPEAHSPTSPRARGAERGSNNQRGRPKAALAATALVCGNHVLVCFYSSV